MMSLVRHVSTRHCPRPITSFNSSNLQVSLLSLFLKWGRRDILNLSNYPEATPPVSNRDRIQTKGSWLWVHSFPTLLCFLIDPKSDSTLLTGFFFLFLNRNFLEWTFLRLLSLDCLLRPASNCCTFFRNSFPGIEIAAYCSPLQSSRNKQQTLKRFYSCKRESEPSRNSVDKSTPALV